MTITRNTKIYIGLGLLGLVLVFALFCYIKPYSKLQWTLLSAAHLPIGTVDGQLLYGNEFARFIDNTNNSFTTKDQYTKAFREFSKEKATRAILLGKNIPIKVADLNKEIDTTEDYTKTALSVDGLQEVSLVTKNSTFGSTPNIIALAAWYSTQQSKPVKTAQDILNNFKTKPEAELLTYDTDTGYISIDQILPEIKFVIKKTDVGQSDIIPSRNGLHVVKVINKINDPADKKIYVRLMHTFIETKGFEDWLDNQIGEFQARYFFIQ